MSICLLEGHKPIEARGVGAYTAHMFTVCSVCNKPLDSQDRLNEIERESRGTASAIQANAREINGDYR